MPAPITEPPQSFESKLSKVMSGLPGKIALRSSVKATPVAEKMRSKLSIWKSRVTVPPGATGSSVNAF